MRLKQQKDSGIAIAHLRTWALVCVALGIVGMVIVLRGVLGIDRNISLEKMKEIFGNEKNRNFLVAAFICQGIYTCAVPLFALLLVEGAVHTRDFSKYLTRTLMVAVVSEVLFDYATKGVFLDLSTLNPAFGVVFALVMLMFFRRYPDRSAGSVLLRLIITVAVMFWSFMILPVEEGPCVVLITSVLWNFRENPKWRLPVSIVAGLACCVFSVFYVATPLAMILLHFYNGEKGNDFKWGRLVAYPGILLAVALAYTFVF